MKYLLPALLLLVFVAALAFAQSAVGVRVGRCQEIYLRVTGDATLTGLEDYVECDSDSASMSTLTLPAAPVHLERHEVWIGNKTALPIGPFTINPNGNPTKGADLGPLDALNESRTLLWVVPGGGNAPYWRVTTSDCCLPAPD